MKKMITLLIAGFIMGSAFAGGPVTWTYSVKQVDANSYEIHIIAQIDKGWHLYAQQQPEDAIAVPTAIKFVKNPLLVLVGKTTEMGILKKVKEESIGVEAWQYSNKVDFVQKVKIKHNVKTNIKGTIRFQVCTDSECLPPATQVFDLSLNG